MLIALDPVDSLDPWTRINLPAPLVAGGSVMVAAPPELFTRTAREVSLLLIVKPVATGPSRFQEFANVAPATPVAPVGPVPPGGPWEPALPVDPAGPAAPTVP